MNRGLPVSVDTRSRRLEPRTKYESEKREENRRGKEREEKNDEKEEHSYKITKKGLRRFVSSFLVLYAVTAVSIFSVFALQDQPLAVTTSSLEREVDPGGEATFTIALKNSSLLEKEVDIILEKDVPSGWMASFCDETQCFYESCTAEIGSFSTKVWNITIITDKKDRQGAVRLLLSCDGKPTEAVQFTITTTENPHFAAELKDTKPDAEGVLFTIHVENTGNVSDHYTVFVPPGVSAEVSEPNMTLAPHEEKEITIHIKEKKSVNTSVILTSDSGLSQTVSLVCERTFVYDFELYSAGEFYMDGPQEEISFDIVNMGDTADTYSVSATCLSSGWEVLCSTSSVKVECKKSERVTLLIKRGEGKSTSVIVTVVSQSGISKNLKLSVYTQETQGKTILAEYFTGSWCYVCSYGEHALRQLKEEYANLIILVYHLKDDIETPGSLKRSRDLYGFTETVSTLVINGNKQVYYSSGGEGAIYFKYKKIIEEMLSQSLKAEIYISGQSMGNTASITAEIHSYISGTYDVYFVLFKNDFPSRGEIKQYIVRDVADPRRIVVSRDQTMVSCTFTIPAGESFAGYGVVVILQDPNTLEVIQANSYML